MNIFPPSAMLVCDAGGLSAPLVMSRDSRLSRETERATYTAEDTASLTNGTPIAQNLF